jgi:hypothetical protein
MIKDPTTAYYPGRTEMLELIRQRASAEASEAKAPTPEPASNSGSVCIPVFGEE